MADSVSRIDLVGGISAFNEADRIGTAIRSLLEQDLPPGAKWTDLWVAVSGSTDATASVVEEWTRRDPRVHLLFEPERRGKSAALKRLFSRVRGTYLVLLDGDSRAGPGSVRALLRAAEGRSPPFGVMGRPTPPFTDAGPLASEIRLLYDLHHAFHAWTLSNARGTHLADNLLLFPAEHLPPLEPGVVNDGAFAGAWLTRNGGALLYAPMAEVTIEVPGAFSDHLAQRRRIHWGHRQVGRLTGVNPSTLQSFVAREPGVVLRMIWDALRGRPRGLRALATLGVLELMAWTLAAWDWIPPVRDHVLWTTIREGPPWPDRIASSTDRTSPSRAPSDRAG
ncbi:MAG: glycosyltransferase [Thermoplasmata archaeon]|nr:glycosyltransferase [Thermoplasmata archaeon]